MRPAVRHRLVSTLVLVAMSAAACGPAAGSPAGGSKTIVVTYSVLGAVVKDLVGDAANVVVLMPNGADPHEWEPSAKDIETVTRADLLVENGLGLEGGMANAFAQAEAAGVHRFVAADHVAVRRVGAGEGADAADPDQAPGAQDPHLWMDPLTMRDAMDALATQLRADLGIDVAPARSTSTRRLGALSDEVAAIVDTSRRRRIWSRATSRWATCRAYGFTSSGRSSPRLHLGRAVRGGPRGPGGQDSSGRRSGHLHRARHLADGGRGDRERDRGAGRGADHARHPRRRDVRHVHQEHRHPDRRQSALRHVPVAGAGTQRARGPSSGTAARSVSPERVHAPGARRGILVSVSCSIVGTFVVLPRSGLHRDAWRTACCRGWPSPSSSASPGWSGPRRGHPDDRAGSAS